LIFTISSSSAWSLDLPIQQNVPIVPVFELQQITNQTVTGATPDKIPLSSQKLLGISLAKLLQKVVQQRQFGVLFYLMQRHRIQNGFDHAGIPINHYDIIRSNRQWHSLRLPYLQQHAEQLIRQLLLSEIVSAFDNDLTVNSTIRRTMLKHNITN
jgi:hypothetical protein